MKKLGIASALLLASASAQAGIVDLFTDPALGQGVTDNQNGLGVVSTDAFNESGAFPTVLGGYRDLYVDAASGATDINTDGLCNGFDACSRLSVFNGVLSFSNDAATGVIGQGEVQWDGNDNSSALTFGNYSENFYFQDGCPVTGCDAFQFDVIFADTGFLFTIGIYTDGNGAGDSWTEVDLLSSGSAGTQSLPFALFDFANTAVCGVPNPVPGVAEIRCGTNSVDLTNVSAMRLILNGANAAAGVTRGAAVDLSIGAITKVPEPATLALLGAGLMAGGLARARRAKKSAA